MRTRKVKLDAAEIERLKKLPESGMGHQRVNVRLPSGRRRRNVVVLNGDTAIIRVRRKRR